MSQKDSATDPQASTPPPAGAPAWQVPARAVPDGGLHGSRSLNADERRTLAKALALRAIEHVAVSYDLVPAGRMRFRLTGRLEAVLGQLCVITLELLEIRIDEPLNLLFVPPSQMPPADSSPGVSTDEPDIEAIRDGVLDIGRAVYEVFVAAIDPYPRKPGVAFTSPRDAGDCEPSMPHPFAPLGKLRRRD